MADKTTAIQSLARTQLVDKDGFITAPWLKAMSLENRDLLYLLGLEPRDVNVDALPRIPDVMPLLAMEPDAHRIPDLMPLLSMQDRTESKDKRLDDALAVSAMSDEPQANKREFAILESLIHYSCEQSAQLARRIEELRSLISTITEEEPSDASVNRRGLVNARAQTFAGDKTFSGALKADTTLEVVGLTKTTGGVHVGGSTDPGADNLSVDGALTLGTDLAVTEGGTGASSAATARSNLGCGTIAVKNIGVTGSFTTVDLKTVTVTDGIITAIV